MSIEYSAEDLAFMEEVREWFTANTPDHILGDADLIRLLGQEPSFDPSDEDQLAAEGTCSPEGPPLTCSCS